MKPRRVLVTIEMVSDATIRDLRNAHDWETRMKFLGTTAKVRRVEARAIKPTDPIGTKGHPWRRVDAFEAKKREGGK